MIISKAVETVMKPRLLPGFFPSWKLAEEWLGFQPYNTTVASYYFLEHPHDDDQTLGTKAVSWLYNKYSIHSEKPAFHRRREMHLTWDAPKLHHPRDSFLGLLRSRSAHSEKTKLAAPCLAAPCLAAWPRVFGLPEARVLWPDHHSPDPGQPPQFQPCGDAQWGMEQKIDTLLTAGKYG